MGQFKRDMVGQTKHMHNAPSSAETPPKGLLVLQQNFPLHIPETHKALVLKQLLRQ